jgi:catalase
VTRHETGNEDNFSQCGDFFRNVLTTAEKERLTDNIAGNLIGAHLQTQFTQTEEL